MLNDGAQRKRRPSTHLDLTPVEIAKYYRVRAPNVRQNHNKEWRGPCPIHKGTRDSFAVDPQTGLWTCHSACGQGGSVYDLEMQLSGKGFKAALADVNVIIGRASADGRIVATYDYADERGDTLYQVVRYAPKDFKHRRPDGNGGWIWKKGQRQVLYRLPEVMEAPIIFVVEGEKDVETLRSYGFVATTNAGGAKAPWLPAYTQTLRGREVILIPDNDAVGKKRVLSIARTLIGVAAKVTILELDSAKDITAWFESGHSELELIAQVEAQTVGS